MSNMNLNAVFSCAHGRIVVFVQLQFSEVLVKWRQFFNFLAEQQGKSGMTVLEQKLELEQLKVRRACSVSSLFTLVLT